MRALAFAHAPLLVALSLSIVAGSERVAVAQSASDLAAAKQWFSEGLKLEEAGKWAEARDRFQKVEAVKPTPQVTFHIGLCYARANDLVEAIVWLERAKERAQQAHVGEVESAADAELKAVRPRVATIELVMPKDAAVTKVTVDGEQNRSAASGAPVLVNPGEHEIAVEFSTGVVRKKIKVAEKETAKVPLDPPKSVASVAPSPPPAAAPATEPPPPAADTTSRGSTVLPWVLVGGGAAFAAGGVVLMITSIGKFRDVCPDVCPASKAQEAQEARDSAVVPYYVGAGLVGAGAIAAGIGVVLLVTSSGRPSLGGAKAEVGALPLVFSGGGGLGLAGKF